MGYDLSEFLGSGRTELDGIPSKKHPKGRTYSFASPSAEVGLWMKNLLEYGVQSQLGTEPSKERTDALSKVFDDDEEFDLYRKVMGDTLDEMVADGVVWEHVQKVFALLLTKHGSGQDIAVTISQAAPQGEAEARPNRQTRRAAERKAGSSSSRASGAISDRTRDRASTSASKTPAKRQAKKTA